MRRTDGASLTVRFFVCARSLSGFCMHVAFLSIAPSYPKTSATALHHSYVAILSSERLKAMEGGRWVNAEYARSAAYRILKKPRLHYGRIIRLNAARSNHTYASSCLLCQPTCVSCDRGFGNAVRPCSPATPYC